MLRAVCCMLLVVRREERKGTKRAREKLRADPVASKKPSVPEGPGTLLVGHPLATSSMLSVSGSSVASHRSLLSGRLCKACGGTVITDYSTVTLQR